VTIPEPKASGQDAPTPAQAHDIALNEVCVWLGTLDAATRDAVTLGQIAERMRQAMPEQAPVDFTEPVVQIFAMPGPLLVFADEERDLDWEEMAEERASLDDERRDLEAQREALDGQREHIRAAERARTLAEHVALLHAEANRLSVPGRTMREVDQAIGYKEAAKFLAKVAQTPRAAADSDGGGRTAAGGPVHGPRAYVVASDRPELFIPATTRGTVVYDRPPIATTDEEGDQ
jgi:FtsZ-binding cell division protein ZapB